jgi:hemerythrin-like domain-containing protein
MHSTITILRAEHVALMSILRSATQLLEESREQQRAPDFELLRTMLFYVAEFPERHHHRKESELLFPRLRARTPLSRHLLDHLEEDHLRGEARIRELEHVLTAFELLGESRRPEFETALTRYLDFYMVHMSLEEREIFPLAERVLETRDWGELDAEMNADRDPLTGFDSQDEYAVLFMRLRRHLRSQNLTDEV